jgi:hypothetical protein
MDCDSAVTVTPADKDVEFSDSRIPYAMYGLASGRDPMGVAAMAQLSPYSTSPTGVRKTLTLAEKDRLLIVEVIA